MSAMGKYDITNEEQLRILTERLDRAAAAEETRVADWQAWRTVIERRIGEHERLIAERLKHPLMDPATVEQMRANQQEITRHLSEQDATVKTIRAEMGVRLGPLEEIAKVVNQVNRLLRWVLLATGGGVFYEVGRLVTARWLR